MDEVLHREPIDRQHHLAGGHALLVVALGDLAAHHEADDLVLGEGAASLRGHPLTVAQHGDGVGDGKDLLEAVRDVDDGHPIGLELREDAREEQVDLGAGERRGRLVEEEQARAPVHRTQNLQHLALPGAERRHALQRVERQSVAREQGARLFPHALPVDHREHLAARGVAPHEDVLGHREVRRQVELLIDHADPPRLRVLGREGVHRLAVELDGAAVGRHAAAEDLEERRLAGAVLPHDGVHAPGRHVEGDALQRLDTAVVLAERVNGELHAPLLEPAAGEVTAPGPWRWSRWGRLMARASSLRRPGVAGPARATTRAPPRGTRPHASNAHFFSA